MENMFNFSTLELLIGLQNYQELPSLNFEVTFQHIAWTENKEYVELKNIKTSRYLLILINNFLFKGLACTTLMFNRLTISTFLSLNK